MNAVSSLLPGAGLALLGAMVLLAGCETPDKPPLTPSTDDAGDRAWARQVMPIVWGRKARGCTEVEVWTDLIAATDRVVVLETMMNQPEYVEHWAEVLIDILEVHKETDFGSQINPVEPGAGCFGNPQRDFVNADLASHVLLEADTGVSAAGGDWNMTDLVQSSIALDNLAPMMLGNLYAMMDRSYNGNFSEQAKRNVVGRHFGSVYLDRQIDCLACHNSDWSMTDGSSGWNRHAPILGSFELALYGASTGASHEDFHHVFHTSGYSAGAPQGPWGMRRCGNVTQSNAVNLGTAYFGGPLDSNANVSNLEQTLRAGIVGLVDGIDRSVFPSLAAACTSCEQNCAGVTPLDPMTAPNAAIVESLLTSTDPDGPNCGSCHGANLDLYFTGHSPEEDWYTHLIGIPSAGADLARVEPGDSAASFLIHKLEGDGTGIMPPAGAGEPLSDADVAQVATWINGLQTEHACASCSALDCSGTERQVGAAEAFAFLTASRLYNSIRSEIYGNDVTLAHGFPRTFGQALALWVGAEVRFVPSRWSLRKVLLWELAGGLYNRLPPALDPDPTPYDLHMFHDPWVWVDPREDSYDPNDVKTHKNAMTDGVVRFPARTLLRSAADSLDWPMPPRLPIDDDNAYPNKQFNLELGQRFSTANPGFRTVDFAGLLAWESTLGACEAPDNDDDWFDALRARLEQINTDGSLELPLSLIAQTIKDRLFSYGEIQLTSAVPAGEPSEQAVLEQLAGSSFDTIVTGAAAQLTPTEVEAAARDMCGALISSPQYQLSGIAPDTGCSETLTVCNPQEPCTYQQICEALSGDLPDPDLVVICNEDSLDVVPAYIEPDYTFCPEPVCDLIPAQIDEECLTRPTIGCRYDPPFCDPRCLEGPLCCGGLRSNYLDGMLHVWWADEAQILTADGVLVLPADERLPMTALKKGDLLRYGDTVIIPAAAQLEVQTRDDHRLIATGKQVRTRIAVVSGPAALAPLDAKPRRPIISQKGIEWLLREGWLRNGAGGLYQGNFGLGDTTGAEESTLAEKGAVVQRRVDAWRARVRANE